MAAGDSPFHYSQDEYIFPYEETLHHVAPQVHEIQSAWLASIEGLTGLDRKTHELIRLVCSAVGRNPGGVERHARLAAEYGAAWEEIVTALILTEPAFGLVPAVQALDSAREGFESAVEPEIEVEDDE